MLEHPAAAKLRSHIMEGEWTKVSYTYSKHQNTYRKHQNTYCKHQNTYSKHQKPCSLNSYHIHTVNNKSHVK